jgi:hypothetical protein
MAVPARHVERSHADIAHVAQRHRLNGFATLQRHRFEPFRARRIAWLSGFLAIAKRSGDAGRGMSPSVSIPEIRASRSWRTLFHRREGVAGVAASNCVEFAVDCGGYAKAGTRGRQFPVGVRNCHSVAATKRGYPWVFEPADPTSRPAPPSSRPTRLPTGIVNRDELVRRRCVLPGVDGRCRHTNTCARSAGRSHSCGRWRNAICRPPARNAARVLPVSC